MNIMTELVFAGLDTIVNAINSFFLYVTKHPNIQENIFNELYRSNLCVIKLKNKSQFHYTNACILETLRIISHIPLGIFRRTLVDIECFGYKLPENTILIPNLWKMHHDEELYPNPYVFKPDRFLDSNNKLLDTNHERVKNLMPFGCGKRLCPGKNVANNIIFLCVTNMLLNFKFNLVGTVDDDPRSFILKSNLEANPYEVFLEKRSSIESQCEKIDSKVDDVKKLLVNNLAEKNINGIFKTKSAKISFKQVTKYRRKSFEPKILCREC
jgi:cytochrome P450